MTWNEVWDQCVRFFTSTGLDIVYALLVLVVGCIIIKVLLKMLQRAFDKGNMAKITQSFILSIVKFALYLFLWLTIIQMIGINITGLVAFIAAAGVAVGVALQGSLANLANGLIIITTKPFKEGDLVNVNGVEGKVKSIKMLSTRLLTTDNRIIILPNSAITSNAVINYSDRKLRRVDLRFDVDYASDIDLVRKVLFDVMNSDGRILLDPAPFVGIDKFGASNITMVTRCWVYNADYWDIYYYLNDNVYNEFKRNKINIAYDQVEVRLRNDEVVLPIRQEKLPKRKEIEREVTLEEADLLLPIALDAKTLKKHKIRKLKRAQRQHEEKLEKINKELAQLQPEQKVQKVDDVADEISEVDSKGDD